MFNKGKKRDDQLRESYKDVKVVTKNHYRQSPPPIISFRNLGETREPPTGRYKDFKTGKVTDHK